MILQLHSSIPVVTPQGNAQAMAIIDYGPEHDLVWVCFLDSNGQCWSYRNSEIRGQKNITMGRSDVEAR